MVDLITNFYAIKIMIFTHTSIFTFIKMIIPFQSNHTVKHVHTKENICILYN